MDEVTPRGGRAGGAEADGSPVGLASRAVEAEAGGDAAGEVTTDGDGVAQAPDAMVTAIMPSTTIRLVTIPAP
jgi:hypothetical protein